MNALGTSIITDGAPVSNNANLQVLNPAVSGAIAPLGGGASPAGGADTRTIQMDNVESVEVIRGVPSVEYGDVATGVVIINAKAGVEPLNLWPKRIEIYMSSLPEKVLLWVQRRER
jgi:outer membrane receptor protein involved in Fe transport